MIEFNVWGTIAKLRKLNKALSGLIRRDKEYGNSNITDFSYADGLLRCNQQVDSFVEYLKDNPDVAYCLAVVTGDRILAKYPDSKIPKGNNEIYSKTADSTTPPMTHEELLERVNTSIKAMA